MVDFPLFSGKKPLGGRLRVVGFPGGGEAVTMKGRTGWPFNQK
jgi:hypothetical protein